MFEKPNWAPVAVRFEIPVVVTPVLVRSTGTKRNVWKSGSTFCGRTPFCQVELAESWASNAASALSTPRKGSVSVIAGS